MRNLSKLLVICRGCAATAAEIPDAIPACLAKAGSAYEVSHKVDPSYLKGDFDGDGKPDYAVLVTHDEAQGIVVCRGSAASPVVVGAGRSFNQMKNLDFSAWRVHARTAASREVREQAVHRRCRATLRFSNGNPPVRSCTLTAIDLFGTSKAIREA